MASTRLDSGFLILYDWLPAFASLSGEDLKELLFALLRYQKDGAPLPDFENPYCNVYAQMIEPTLARRIAGQVAKNKARGVISGTTSGVTSGDTSGATSGGTSLASRAGISRAEISRAEQSGAEGSGADAREAEERGSAAPGDSVAPTPNSIGNCLLLSAALPQGPDSEPAESDGISELIADGISESYINERRYRAEDYARLHKRRVGSVLREWWERDKRNYSDRAAESSFDTDDFFGAAMENSLKIMRQAAERRLDGG